MDPSLNISWLGLTVPLFVLATVLLAFVIRSLVRTVRSSVVTSVPLRAEQQFGLPRSGNYRLFVEGKFGSRDFGALEFFLNDALGREVALDAVYFRARVSSFGRVRLQLRRFHVDGAGTFTLRIAGIPASQDPENRIVIAVPFTTRMVLHILAIVFLSTLAIGSLVASSLILLGADGRT